MFRVYDDRERVWDGANVGCRYPDEVTVDDLGDESEGTGTNTPAGEPGNDFFSSWEKPSIKRPSNPPSRTSTPGINRTASPFLNPNGNGNGATSRPKSPLKTSDSASDGTTPAAQPTASRAVPSSTAVRKTATAAKPKSNILGAKKAKLGAKKVDSAALDFDEAEKKAREEAERKERLGYDPDEVSTTPAENTIVAAQPDSSATTIHQPTPLSPGRAGGFGSTGQSRQRSDSEMEKLGMATRKLGFGQVGAAAQKTSTAGAATRGLGFGAVSKPVVQGKPPHSPTQTPKQLTNPSVRTRRIPNLRPRKIRRTKRHLLRRILRPQRLRPLGAVGGSLAVAGLRGRAVHLLQRVFRPPRRGRG